MANTRYLRKATRQQLTPKRESILAILTSCETPLSAYEILQKYNQQSGEHILAMSVYRILEFLESAGMVVHLHSVNKYVAASCMGTVSANTSAVLLICMQCSKISQVSFDENASATLSQQVRQAGFNFNAGGMELPTMCTACSEQNDEAQKEIQA